MPEIFVQTYEEFLYVENPQNVQNVAYYKAMKLGDAGSPWKQIGTGGVGKVFAKEDDQVVIKKMPLCLFGPDARHCKLATINRIIYMIPRQIGPQETLWFIQCPDFLIEQIIGKHINKFIDENKLVGVPRFISAGLDCDSDDPASYMTLEKLSPLPLLPNPNRQNPRLLSEIAFRMWQIMISISFMQDFMRFTHYDLHWDNIMSKNIPDVCIEYTDQQQLLSFYISAGLWPVINDFGTSIFSLKFNQNTRLQYMNTTNNLEQPKIWNSYNEYFDGLTLLKSLTRYLFDKYKASAVTDIRDELYKALVNCFVRNGTDVGKYYLDPANPDLYRPDINMINKKKDGLFSTHEVIRNLYSTFSSEGGYWNMVKGDENRYGCNYAKSLKIGHLPGNISMPREPVFTIQELPDIPFSDQKCYFMDFGNFNKPDNPNGKNCAEKIPSGIEPVNITVIREVASPNIFCFSLFSADQYLQNTYRWFYDSKFTHPTSGGKFGKSRPDAFYSWYLGNQIRECIHLINDTIGEATPYAYPLIRNQWVDFGTLMIVDKHVLSMPMMVRHPQRSELQPWNKVTKTACPADVNRRRDITRMVRQHGVKHTLNHYNYGTVLDYILYRVDSEIVLNQRYRFGLYRYDLSSKFDVNVTIPVFQNGTVNQENHGVKNTSGMLGSVIRFTALQDPSFECVLLRDAHSTMPNRNFQFDRKWYETWRYKTNKRIWAYHGAFYNPQHGDGQKISFAATWGACKRHGANKIFSNEDYANAFGISDVGENYYNRTGYGIDERLMFRLTTMQVWLDSTYFVGMTHLLYLIIGQINPRGYRIFNNTKIGGMNPEDFIDKKDTDDLIKIPEPRGDKNSIVVEDYISNSERKNPDESLSAFIEKVQNKGFNLGNDFGINTLAVIVKNKIPPKSSKGKEPGNKLISELELYNIANPDREIPLMTHSEFENKYIKGPPYVCRQLDFVMPDRSFYTDMRCVFLQSMKQASLELNINRGNLSFGHYFHWLDQYLLGNVTTNQFTVDLIKMLPPRWNIWQYLFGEENLDLLPIENTMSNIASPHINMKTICDINKLFWTGNVFNYDRYFFGDEKNPQQEQLPTKNILPAEYPSM